MAVYNAHIPLPPSVHASDGESESEGKYSPLHRGRIAENERRLSEQEWARYRLDHYKACGGTLNPGSTYAFDFLRLPVEIRYKIYELILKQQAPVKQNSNDLRGPIDLRIFVVSRDVYTEAIEVFYKVNTFAVWIKEPDSLPLFVRKSSGTQTPRPTSLIRKMHIWIIFPWMTEDPPLLQQVKTLAAMLSRCKHLIDLHMTFAVTYAQHTPGLEQKFSELLECFTAVKRVRNVRFTDAADLQRLDRMGTGGPYWVQYGAVETKEEAERMKGIMEGQKD